MDAKRTIISGGMIVFAVTMALLLPVRGIAGSLEPPSHAVDGSGNPVPTTLSKFACRGAFTVNNDGTVTDCKTGLVWLRNAYCLGQKNWNDALASCATLASGACGLYDGSLPGDWRLPTIEEFRTLPDRTYSNPALSNARGDAQWTDGNAFTNVHWGVGYDWAWSSSSSAYFNGGCAWVVSISYGAVVDFYQKGNNGDVWCVRGRHRYDGY